MKHHRLLSGILLAALGASTAGGIIYCMWPARPQETLASAPAGFSGTVASNPFAKGGHMIPALPTAREESSMAVMPTPPAAPATQGVFRVDDKGDLVLDAQTKTRLDVLISSLPKNATRHEMQSAEATAFAGLKPRAAQQASRMLNAYIAYLKAEAELNESVAKTTSVPPGAMPDKLAALRREYLGVQAAEALFASQEMQERYGIRIAMIDADTTLTAQEKLARIDALQRTLPEDAIHLETELEASRTRLAMEQSVSVLRQQGASDAQVQQFRAQYIGEEGARDMGEMEVQKAEWERKQQAFLQQRNAIAQMNLSEGQKQDRLESLLNQIYTPEELPIARRLLQSQ